MGERKIAVPSVEAARMVSVSLPTFHRMVAAGELPGPIDPTVTVRRRRWSVAKLERFADPEIASVPADHVGRLLRVVDL